jgi:hypothetical protein
LTRHGLFDRKSLIARSLTPSQSSSPDPEYSQTASSLTDLQTSLDSPQHQNHDGTSSPTSYPESVWPAGGPELSIPMNDMSSRDEERPPPDEEFGDNVVNGFGTQSRGSVFLLPLCGFAVFLAPVVIVSGMTASHGDNWKLAFIG